MKDKPLFISSLIFFVLCVLFIIALFSPFKEIFSPFITTIALVYFLSPLVSFLKKKGVNSIISAFLVYFVIIAALLVVVLLAVPKIYEAVIKIWDIIAIYPEKLGIEIIPEEIFSGNMGRVYETVVSAVKTMTSITVGAVAAFYILADSKGMKETAREFMPLFLKPSVKILTDDVKSALDSFFKGQLVIAAILFLIDTVFLYAMGIPYAIGLGAIAGVLDIIPYAGAFISMAVIVLVTLVECPDKTLIVLIGLLVIQQIENNIITPKISSDTLKLHPAVTVLVLYVGAFGGFWGILLAVPFTCIIRKIAQRFIQSLL